MRQVSYNCIDCGTEKNRDNTYTYTDSRSKVLRFKSRCVNCDKKIITEWVNNNTEKHNHYSKMSCRRRKADSKKMISKTSRIDWAIDRASEALKSLRINARYARMSVSAIFLAGILLTSCQKDEICARIATIYVQDNSDHPGNVTVEGEGGSVTVMVHDMIVFEFDNGNKYNIVKAGEDYSHLSDLDECELQYLGYKPFLRYQ